MENFEFVTDAATLCVFDPEALRHRLSDDADWWSDSEERNLEMNLGNVAFFDLGGDGKFTVVIKDGKAASSKTPREIRCASGRIFVGAGEEATSDGLEPECVRGGAFLAREVGVYFIQVVRISKREITLHITSE